MRTEAYGDPATEERAAAQDSDELCRLLLRSPWGWGPSTRHPARLGDILVCAEEMPPRHRDALLNGLPDAAGGLETAQRQLMGRALRSGIARARRAAFDRLSELDRPEAALRRVRSDPDRTARAWHPPGAPAPAQPQLPGMPPSP